MLDSEKEPFSWGFEAGFLRSPVNPRMLLLNRTPEIDCADDGNATGNASAWNLVSVANDLLRVDLSSLFNEIGGHFRERAKLRFTSICRTPFVSPLLPTMRNTLRWTTQPNQTMTTGSIQTIPTKSPRKQN